ncbi:MAG: hypothetical protein QXT63_07955, partial [Thermoplasmata archaeon]
MIVSMEMSILAPDCMKTYEESKTKTELSEICSNVEQRNTTEETTDFVCSEENNNTIQTELDAFCMNRPMNETVYSLIYGGLQIINKFFVNLSFERKHKIINNLYENITQFFEKIERNVNRTHTDSSRWVPGDNSTHACHVGWFSQACKNLGYKLTISQNEDYLSQSAQPDTDDPAYSVWNPFLWPTTSQQYRHSYLINEFGVYTGWGNADDNAYDYAWRAYTHFSATPPQTDDGWRDLAYASHYMADLGNPMHTGYYISMQGIWAILQAIYHPNYENWVYQRGDIFRAPEVITEQMIIPSTVQQVDDSCRALASYTAARFDDLLFGFIDNNEAQILSVTRQCVSQMMRRLNGLIYLVGPNVFYFWEDWESATTLGTYINPNGNWCWYADINPNSGTDTWDVT